MPATWPVPEPSPTAVGVAIASGGAAWELGLLPLVERHRSGLHLARRCVDLADLLAVCSAGLVSVAVVDASLPRLDRDVVQRLRETGVAVVAVEDQATTGTAVSLGVADVASSETSPEELVARLHGIAARSVPTAHSEPDLPEPTAPLRPSPQSTGRLIAVWGPAGAPGRSTVAVNLAHERAMLASSVLLVDADPAGGAVSTLLGILDEAPGLAAACRTASRGRLDVRVLAAHALAVGPTMRVLTGATRPDRWRELRPALLEVVWDAARSLADEVVVDCGSALAADPVDPLDRSSFGPGAVTRSVLQAADVVVVVGGADPLGMLRLLHALDQLADVTASRPVVLVNRVRASVVGPRPGRQIRDALGRFADVPSVHLLPDDPAAADLALRRARPLAEVVPGSSLRTALRDLAASLSVDGSGVAASPSSRRRRAARRSGSVASGV